MAEDVRLSGPVEIRSDLRERVALDLAVKIANYEGSNESSKREYWFKLYHQSYLATMGHKPEDVLKR